MGLAMIGVLWAYEGWQYVTFSAGEALDPQRTFPRAIVAGTASLIAIYVFANVGYFAALGDQVARSDRVAAEAVGAVVGGGAAKLIALVILISIFSATNGLTITRTDVSILRWRVMVCSSNVSPKFIRDSAHLRSRLWPGAPGRWSSHCRERSRHC
jgi:amino acid transporter